MSILIKGMEMPKYCDIDCPIFPDSICPVKTIIEMKELGDNRHPNCPLVPVPPHGRLIDADGEIGVNVTMMPGEKCRVDLIAPTIIPAEEDE